MINKRGQSLGLSIISLILIIIAGFIMINFLTGEVTRARVDMACSDVDNIEDGNKLFCIILNATIPYWIWIILSVAIGAVTIRYVF